MKKWQIFAFISLFLIIMIYLSDILPAIYNGIPLNVYWRYWDFKKTYTCGDECFYRVLKCIGENNSLIWESSGGYIGSYGTHYFYSKEGEEICNFYWSTDMRDSFQGRPLTCPKTINCKLIIGNRAPQPNDFY